MGSRQSEALFSFSRLQLRRPPRLRHGVIGNRVQGVVGLVFGNENSASSEDSYVERLLDCISNGVLAEDRRIAIAELQFVVAESRAAQQAFGAMGFPILLSVLKEECDDVEMVHGALETLVSALTPIDQAKALKNEEIQMILVFEGAFKKIFSVIKRKGVRKVVVLFSLNYHVCAWTDIHIALETIDLLIMGGPEIDTGKDVNRLTNKAVLVQKKVFNHFLMLGVESQWAPVPVRCTVR
ncbi:Golgin candidate 6 [Camellia lanceoleosa]|uniref:Golgin candidate 6 n=1 Tax=Camellia lanceoleosa TaxID=1840588 RepID=A0ACC0G1D1_9ERIC|nr:Golgin candidate 6 [Camellia lanceoleosa]